MITSRIVIKFETGGREYYLDIAHDAPTVDIKQALTYYKGIVVEHEEKAIANEKIDDAKEEKVSEGDPVAS